MILLEVALLLILVFGPLAIALVGVQLLRWTPDARRGEINRRTVILQRDTDRIEREMRLLTVYGEDGELLRWSESQDQLVPYTPPPAPDHVDKALKDAIPWHENEKINYASMYNRKRPLR